MNPDSATTGTTTEGAATAVRRTPLELLRAVAERFPQRWAGSDDERGAQLMLTDHLQDWVDEIELKRFRYSSNLYLVIAAHFGLALVGSALAFWSRSAATVIHAAVAISYLADSARWLHLMRRLMPSCESQNVVASQIATQPLRKRIVFVAHADAAPAGKMFEGSSAKVAAAWVPRWITECLKPLRWGVLGLFLLAAIDLWIAIYPDAWSFPGIYISFNILAAVIVLSNLEAARAEVVPGANDNLSGCVATAMIAERLRAEKPDDVELVYVLTGCEEAGTGGAYCLARQMRNEWKPENTVFVILDCLGGGEMTAYIEGEVVPQTSDEELLERADATATHFYGEPLRRYYPPAGATDQIAFAAFGYRGIALGTIDGNAGMPTHYHKMSDTPDHIDENTLNKSIDFAVAFCRDLIGR